MSGYALGVQRFHPEQNSDTKILRVTDDIDLTNPPSQGDVAGMSAGEIIWQPTEDFLQNSNVSRLMRRIQINDPKELIHRSASDPEWFWETILDDMKIEWYRKYDRLMDMSDGFPWTKWFVGGEINIAHNCLDRHAFGARKDQTALIWEGDDGNVRSYTYEKMAFEVSRLANAIKNEGLVPGDSAGIYMPMAPETVFAMFACFKTGVAAIPIFSAFGSGALARATSTTVTNQ